MNSSPWPAFSPGGPWSTTNQRHACDGQRAERSRSRTRAGGRRRPGKLKNTNLVRQREARTADRRTRRGRRQRPKRDHVDISIIIHAARLQLGRGMLALVRLRVLAEPLWLWALQRGGGRLGRRRDAALPRATVEGRAAGGEHAGMGSFGQRQPLGHGVRRGRAVR